ncbi:hypothetical protein PO883_32395, partial [Massilia sp. DJPM01]|uniref:hypothetical protein n=1 Tax=Massilia sp. DJPM01 TaxID=3024404 RepID=UPI00259D79D4
MMLAMLLMAAGPAMVVVREDDVKRDEAPPHGAIGMSTAYRISDAVPAPRAMEFRKRVLHPGAAIGVHRIEHDEVYFSPERARSAPMAPPSVWCRAWLPISTRGRR